MKNLKTGLTVIVYSLLVSCATPPAANLKSEAGDAVKKQINDYFFKNNGKVNLYQFDVLSVDSVSQCSIDSVLLNTALDRTSMYTKITQGYLQDMRDANKKLRLYALINSPSLLANAKDDAREVSLKAKRYLDTANAYAKIDSILGERINLKYTSRDFLKVKAFVKATAFEDRDSSNVLDTFNFYLDSKKRILRITDLVKDSVNKYILKPSID